MQTSAHTRVPCSEVFVGAPLKCYVHIGALAEAPNLGTKSGRGLRLIGFHVLSENFLPKFLMISYAGVSGFTFSSGSFKCFSARFDLALKL